MRTGASAPKVDLIVDKECPNIEAARSLITRALSAVGLPLEWREWRRDATDTPPGLRGFGSPTILVDGVDVTGATGEAKGQEHANSCRLYNDAGVLRGVPPLDLIEGALAQSISRT